MLLRRFPTPRFSLSRPRTDPAETARRIIVGLGNPGARYEGNRHNAGARALQELSRRLDLPLRQRHTLVITAEGRSPWGPVVLARPRTFMNESGRAVLSLLTRYRAKPEQLILLVDDIDLPLGRLRVRPHGSDGGLKGLRSIRETIGSLDFPRVRIGVGRPAVDGKPSWDPDMVAGYLLSDPAPAERAVLREAEARAADAVVAILRDGVEAAMNEYNAERASPSAPSPS